MRLISVFFAGLLFAVGLIVGGMTQPSKVVGFLDLTGSWDPSLAFVMGGAILVHATSYRFVMRRPSPVFALNFQVPTQTDVTPRLVVGSALFGVGWGLAGYCPGPALSSAALMEWETLLFVGSLVASWIGYSLVTGRLAGIVNRQPNDRELGTPEVIEVSPR